MRRLLQIQGVYFFLTGLWAILDIWSFMAVTGPKHDVWLVKTVGLLVGVSGLAFLRESRVKPPSRTVALLACWQAVALAGIDVYYVAKNVISPIYLADAAVEIILIGLWIYLLRFHSISRPVQ